VAVLKLKIFLAFGLRRHDKMVEIGAVLDVILTFGVRCLNYSFLALQTAAIAIGSSVVDSCILLHDVNMTRISIILLDQHQLIFHNVSALVVLRRFARNKFRRVGRSLGGMILSTTAYVLKGSIRHIMKFQTTFRHMLFA